MLSENEQCGGNCGGPYKDMDVVTKTQHCSGQGVDNRPTERAYAKTVAMTLNNQQFADLQDAIIRARELGQREGREDASNAAAMKIAELEKRNAWQEEQLTQVTNRLIALQHQVLFPQYLYIENPELQVLRQENEKLRKDLKVSQNSAQFNAECANHYCEEAERERQKVKSLIASIDFEQQSNYELRRRLEQKPSPPRIQVVLRMKGLFGGESGHVLNVESVVPCGGDNLLVNVRV